MWRYLPALVALPLLVAFGVAEGVWNGRWVNDRAVEDAAARLARVPLAVGEWQGEAQELDARQAAKAELAGHLLRRYVHPTSKAVLSVMLVCGRSGPVAVHPPDICYGGVGFALMGTPVREPVTAGGPANSFKVGKFSKVGAPVPEYLRIFWAWSVHGDSWTSPDNPRLTFARAPALYKLYVVRPMADFNEPLESDPAIDFLRQFLPIVETTLNAAPADTSGRSH